MTLLLICALGFSVWLTQSAFLKVDEFKISQPTTPDAFMTEVDYMNFDSTGQWSARIHADRITHYLDQDTSQLEAPRMISRSNEWSWIITAQHGMAQQGLKTIHLTDQVSIDHIHAVRGKTLSLNTSALTIYPQQKFAQTDQPVTILQPGSTVNAVGLTADMNTGDIHLLSEVKGSYQSQKKESQP